MPADLLEGMVRQEIAAGSVRDGTLVKCYKECLAASGPSKERWQDLFLDARLVYMTQHKGFVFESYKIEGARGAVLFHTKDGRLYIHCAGSFDGSTPVDDLILRIDHLSDNAFALRDSTERTTLLARIATLASFVAGLWAGHAGKDKLTPEEHARLQADLGVQKAELRRVEDQYRAIADRQAKAHYLLGTLVGLTVAGTLALLWSGNRDALPFAVPWMLVACGVAGTLGATVSVAMRMAKPSVQMDLQVGGWLVRLFGGFRPLLGGIFGALLYILVNGSLLPLDMPAPGRAASFFVGGAFLMGFNERLMRDLLVSAASRITPAAPDGDSTKKEPATA